MQADEQDRFWRLYDKNARPAIERACRSLSRSLTDNGMDPDDMIAWADERVWRMLERGRWPTFHDDPSAEVAAGRLAGNARTMARWAYLALSRRHWRRQSREQAHLAGLSRAERLSMVSARDEGARRADVEEELARLRAAIDRKVRQRLAASWAQTGEKHRIAMALGAIDEEDQALIDKVIDGKVKPNTVQQMRSRSLRRARDVFSDGRGAGAILLAIMASVLVAAPAKAGEGGERTGGRGGIVAPTNASIASEGERTGGRKGSMSLGASARASVQPPDDERTGGRKGG